MSMLAELKRKPSWVLNPRASEWSKDQNKLGQKMLEKMGWSAGKGLGAQEQGDVEALRIGYKADVRGLGAERKKEQEFWLQQQESFQSLLEQLGGDEKPTTELKSLEEKSRTSRTRVHYHKFTRGKDISRYSAKDLSCIVGSGVALPKGSQEADSFEEGSALKDTDDDLELRQSRKRTKKVDTDDVGLLEQQSAEDSTADVADKPKKSRKNKNKSSEIEEECPSDEKEKKRRKKEKRKKKNTSNDSSSQDAPLNENAADSTELPADEPAGVDAPCEDESVEPKPPKIRKNKKKKRKE